MGEDPKRVEAALTAMGAGASIRDRFNDASRPDWESYKKANQAKMDGTADQDTAMEEYRRQLDREREAKLARGTNHAASKKKKKKKHYSSDSSDSSDSDSSSSDERRRKKRKKKRKKKHKRRRESDSSSDSEDSRERRKHRKKKKHKKKRDRDRSEDDDDEDKEHYRLSSFFQDE